MKCSNDLWLQAHDASADMSIRLAFKKRLFVSHALDWGDFLVSTIGCSKVRSSRTSSIGLWSAGKSPCKSTSAFGTKGCLEVNNRPQGEQLTNGAWHGKTRHNELNPWCTLPERHPQRIEEYRDTSQRWVLCKGEYELKRRILAVGWASDSRRYITWQVETVVIDSSLGPCSFE